MRSGLLWGAVLACCGCAHEEEGPEPRRYANEGTVCLSSDASNILHAQVVAPGCMSSTCDRLTESVCRLRVVDDRLEIESSFTLGHTPGLCTSDCKTATAQCSSELAVTGDFTVNHGAESESVNLPQAGLLLFQQWPGPDDCAWFSP
jgi:hypothetical protein